jgi:hypothetical protein
MKALPTAFQQIQPTGRYGCRSLVHTTPRSNTSTERWMQDISVLLVKWVVVCRCGMMVSSVSRRSAVLESHFLRGASNDRQAFIQTSWSR